MKKHIFPLLAFCLLFSSCGEFEEVTFSGIESIKVIKLSQEGADVEITAKIKNPNKSSFTIYRSDFDVTINGIKTGRALLANSIKIKPKCEETYTFKVHSDFSNLSIAEMPKLLAIALKRSVNIEMKGDLKVGKVFMKKSYPISIVRNVPLDRI